MLNNQLLSSKSADPLRRLRQVEGREWWLWGFAVAVTLILTLGILSLTFPGFHLPTDRIYTLSLKEWVRGLVALVLLFDIYTIYQHLLLQRVRRQLAENNKLFQLISENAADMIAVVDTDGRRLYNSPAYQKILGYDPEELEATVATEQIHPDDRARVAEAAEKAKLTGTGERLEYRIRHKDGSWRVLESTASAIRGTDDEIEGLVVVNRDITDRKRAEDLLAHNAFHDELTGLPNRSLFFDRLGRAVAVARRHADFKFAVLFIDIDGFKVFNDSLGHAAGDTLLIHIAQRLNACLRQADTVSRAKVSSTMELLRAESTLARPGGDEFAVLIEELRDPTDAIRVAERIQKNLTTPFAMGSHHITVTASIGIVFKGHTANDTSEELLRDAEIAMHRAKRLGKARCEVFDNTMHATAVRRLQLETDMRRALEQREFLVYYQPIVSLRSKQIVGFEALTRWQRPQGMVMPGEFIGVANETGIIVSINQQLMLDSFRELRRWQELFPSNPPLAMSVNIAPQQFQLPDLSCQIGQILQQSRVDPNCVHLEITETIAMADAQKSAVVLRELKALGVHLEIDDFGTGYSSLSRLQRFPVDTLKIDRAFISQMDSDFETHEIVRIIIMLANNLGLKVVAEGVETEGQVEILTRIRCELAQGYLFSQPVSPQSVETLLKSGWARSKVGGAITTAQGAS
jgi:PAS domain S-box-containing protein